MYILRLKPAKIRLQGMHSEALHRVISECIMMEMRFLHDALTMMH